MNTTGYNIRRLRKKINLTQVELSEKANVSSQVVSNWERGYTLISTADLASLKKIFKVPADEILGTDADIKDEEIVYEEETEEQKIIRESKERMKKTIDDFSITDIEAAKVMEKFHNNLFKE